MSQASRECEDCQRLAYQATSSSAGGPVYCADHDPATPGSAPFVDTTISEIEAFLGKLRDPNTAQAAKDDAMRGFGRSVGMFLLGILDVGGGVPVALHLSTMLIQAVIKRPSE
jgi:hypothetical protein